ncbi:hypothetical protein RB601_003588 [Gaeumannomyces tritici]
MSEMVAKLDVSARPFKYSTEWSLNGVRTAGSVGRHGGSSENKYWQNGISARTVCDGAMPILCEKRLGVIGGGNLVAKEAMFLILYGSRGAV